MEIISKKHTMMILVVIFLIFGIFFNFHDFQAFAAPLLTVGVPGGHGEFFSPMGLSVDSSGNLYVVDNTNNRIQKFDSSGVYLSQFGINGSSPGQFYYPQGVAVNTTGNIVVADTDNNRIQIFDNNGLFQKEFGINGTSTGQFFFPRNVAVNNTGYIYVADSNNYRVQIFNPSGNFVRTFGMYGSQNGNFSSTYGLAFDSGGNVYVSDVYNSRIEKFSSSGTFLLSFGTNGTGNGQLYTPFGIAIDSSNNVYVADHGNERIEKFNSTGAYQSQFGSFGSGNGQFSGPQNVAIDNNSGNIYVSDIDNNRIQKFNSSGVYLSQIGITSNGALRSPTGVAFDNSGNIVVPSSYSHNIVKFSNTGSFITQFGTLGTGNGQFLFPLGIANDTSGNVYVADTDNNRIEKFNSAGVYQSQFGSYGFGNGNFYYPIGVAVNSTGFIFVADQGNNRIQIFNSTGAYQSQFGSYGTSPGQFQNPIGVAVSVSGNIYVIDYFGRLQIFDSSGDPLYSTQVFTQNSPIRSPGIAVDHLGNVYVTDLQHDVIQKFNSTASFQSQFGSSGTADGQFRYPSGILVSSSGNIYVADSYNNRVQKFTSTGVFVSQIGSSVTGFPGDGQFNFPVTASSDNSGNIYVADSRNNQIQKFDSSGTFLLKFGSTGNGTGQFHVPDSVAHDNSGHVYVVDTLNSRVEKFDSSGNFILQFGTNGTGNGQFFFPVTVAVNSTGYVYVVDSGNFRVQIFNSTGAYKSQFGSLGSGNGQFNGVIGIALDSSGNVYTTESYNNRIQKFNSAGIYQSQFGTNGTGNGQFNDPEGIAVDSHGNIFVADTGNNRIQWFNTSGAFVGTSGTAGTGSGQFNIPVDISIDSNNNLYVSDASNNRVQILSDPLVQTSVADSVPLSDSVVIKHGISKSLADSISISDNLSTPKSSSRILLDSISLSDSVTTIAQKSTPLVNTLPISDSLTTLVSPPTIHSAIPYYSTLGVTGVTGTDNAHFNTTSGITVDSSKNIYVADSLNNRVQKFNSAGIYQFTLGTSGISGSDNTHFNNPRGIAINSTGFIFVTDQNNSRIQIFDSAGVYQSTKSVTSNPTGIAMDSSNNLYVTESDATVRKFNSAGTLLLTIGTPSVSGSDNAHLSIPRDVAVDSLGNIYVADELNDRIQIFNSTGVYQYTLGVTGVAGTDNAHLNLPFGVAIDSLNNLYVADNGNHRIQKFNSAGVYLSTLGTGSPGSDNARFNSPRDVAVDSSRYLYVSDTANQRVQIFGFLSSISDSIPLSDSVTTQKIASSILSDSIPLSDSVTTQKRTSSMLSDSIPLSDSVIAQRSLQQKQTSASDSIPLSDFVTASATKSVLLADSMVISETTTASKYSPTASVPSSTGAGNVAFHTSNGIFTDLASLSTTSLPTTGKPTGVNLPFGAFSFNVTGVTPGSTNTINMTLPSSIPSNAQYWKIQGGIWINATSLITITNGGNSILLTITDGGLGDADGIANGIISDPGAIVILGTASIADSLQISDSVTAQKSIQQKQTMLPDSIPILDSVTAQKASPSALPPISDGISMKDSISVQRVTASVYITSLSAFDNTGMNTGYGNGLKITVLFSEGTNQPGGTGIQGKSGVDSIFTFSQNLGNSYQGQWTDSRTFVITILDSTGATPPAIGVLTATVKQSANLLNVAGTSSPSTSTSPVLSGTFGSKPGPYIASMIVFDPTGSNPSFANGDTITLTFSEPTNQPGGTAIQPKSSVDGLFTFSQILGVNYQGQWVNPSTFVITSVDSSTNAVTIGTTTTTVLVTANLKNTLGTSLSSTSTSPPLSGHFGQQAGPAISDFVASDPTGLHAVYTNGTALTIRFAQPTNQAGTTGVLNKNAIGDTTGTTGIFQFSQNLGNDYTGIWSDPSTFVITITDSRNSAPPTIGTLTATVLLPADLKSKDGTSKPSTSVSPVLSGSFGNRAGPYITSFAADDPNLLGAIYHAGNTLTVSFSNSTNRPGGTGILDKTAVNSIFTFSQNLGADYQGQWTSPSTFVITILDTTGATPAPSIGTLTATVNISANLRTFDGTSLASSSVSPYLTGSFGNRAGPYITSLVAADPTGSHGVYSNGITITARFSEFTNTPGGIGTLSKTTVDSIFTFSQNLGNSYQGQWTDPKTFVITILDSTGSQPPTIGGLTLGIKPSAGMRNAPAISLASDTVSPPLSGSFGNRAGPFITDFVADDPSGTHNSYSDGITLLIKFSEPTNQPGGTGILDRTAVDSIFTFSQNLGNSYQGQWTSPSTFVVTILDSSGSTPPTIGGLSVLVQPSAVLQNAASTSQPSNSVSSLLTGTFGTFTVSIPVAAGGSAIATLPSGIQAELTLPSDSQGTIQITRSDIDTNQAKSGASISFLGTVSDIIPQSGASCSTGCTISFTFTQSDAASAGVSPFNVKIEHDINEDGIFESNEVLPTTVTQTGPTTFVATTIAHFNSKFAIGGVVTALAVLGAHGGDSSSSQAFSAQGFLSFKSLSQSAQDAIRNEDPYTPIAPSSDPTVPYYPFSLGGNNYLIARYANTIQTVTEKVGVPINLQLASPDTSISHVALYTNMEGLNKEIGDSDTYIIYDKGSPLQIIDPHGFFSDVKIDTTTDSKGIEKFGFTIIFAKPMSTSNIFVREWDEAKYSSDTKIKDAIHVIESPQNTQTTKDLISDKTTTTPLSSIPSIGNDDMISYIKQWGGYSSTSISDSQLLGYMGIRGIHIPSWVLKDTKWIETGDTSLQEFKDTIQYLSEKGFIR